MYYCSKYSLTSGFIAFQESGGAYTVGDFMTKREELHVVKPTTSVDEGALFAVMLCLGFFH